MKKLAIHRTGPFLLIHALRTTTPVGSPGQTEVDKQEPADREAPTPLAQSFQY